MQSPPSSRVGNNSNNRSVNLGYNVHLSDHRSETYEQSGLANGPSNGNVDSYDQQQSSATSCAHPTSKKSLPPNGKKTKGRVKIKMEFIDNKLRRYTTFSKRKTGIMKKAYELSTLTGTQVMLLVASETGHVYTFATRKLQPMITSEAGKALIQTCLNSPDPPPGPGSSSLDQRMSATGFEETDLTYSVGDDCDKLLDNKGAYSSSPSSPQSGEASPSQLMRSDSPNLVTLPDVPSSTSQQQSTNAGFATILATGPGSLGQTIQISGFQAASDSATSSSGSPSVNTQPVYRLPTQGSFSVAISNATKNQSGSSDGTQASSSPGAISVVQDTQQQNLSLVSGNVVIPASQAILQAASGSNPSSNSSGGVQGAFMYHTAQGLVYATPPGLSERVIINLGQDQNATAPSQQYITIPVTLSLTPAQQLLRVSSTTSADSSQSSGGNPPKKAKK